MNACVGKPLPMNQLKEAIEKYCHRRSKHHQIYHHPSAIVSLASNTCIAAIDDQCQNASFSLSKCVLPVFGNTFLKPSMQDSNDIETRISSNIGSLGQSNQLVQN
jgi:hypothetical protein